MDRLLFSLAAATLACGADPAFAADTAASAAEAEPIVITGEHVAYGVKATTTATKTPTDIRNIPQALTTISGAQIADQQLRSVGELLQFVPGASYGSGEGNRDQIVLRGNSSTADFFIDGVRDDVQYFRDFYNIDRVEVLKGPNAMIFGRGGGGGILNRILKKPTFALGGSVSASTDNWGAMRFTGDIDQPISGTVGVRLNGMFEDSDSFRHHVNLKRYGINPTVALLTAPDTRIDLSYEYFHDRRTADRGVPANGDEPLRGHTRDFFGDPDISFARVNANIATVGVEHRFSDTFTLKNHTQFGTYDKFYQNVFANSFNPVTNVVALAGYNNLNNRTNLFSQTDLVWQNRLGGIDQTLLLGFEVGSERSRNKRNTANFPTGSTVPVSNPTVDSNAIFTPSTTDADNRVHADVAAAYIQDQIRPASWIEIVAGLRFDSFKVSVDDFRSGGEFDRADHLWSPRIGLVLKPDRHLSIYANYSRSYLPQSGDQFSSLTSITEGLKPERFDNYEVGAKLQLPGGLLATAAIYRLDRTNTRASDPSNPALTVLTGAQRSRGLELGLERSITSRWLISGGYALQKAEITSTTTAAPAGREVPLVPRHSFSLWNRYDVTKQLGFGLGVIARSRSFATISNAVELPGYTRLDAALYYKLPLGIQGQLNVENLLGVHYFPTANADNNIAPGAPRTAKLTLGYKF
ncbi:MAG TPA: TonB-dependent siderophore receptor [Sphingomicrobium sp.]